MTSRAQAALVTRARLHQGPRAAQRIETDSQLPIARVVSSDRPNLDYIIAEPVGLMGTRWALTAVDDDGRRMRYTEDGLPEFNAGAKQWRRPLWILVTLVMAALLWAVADGAGLLNQAMSLTESLALVEYAPTVGTRTVATVAVLVPMATAGAALACLLGRFLADALLRR